MGYLTASEVTAIRRLHADTRRPTTTRQLADTFQCSSATISYWLRKAHLPGHIPRVPPKNCRKALKARRQRVGKRAAATVLKSNRINPTFSSTTSI
jgi:hypothetical protein